MREIKALLKSTKESLYKGISQFKKETELETLDMPFKIIVNQMAMAL